MQWTINCTISQVNQRWIRSEENIRKLFNNWYLNTEINIIFLKNEIRLLLNCSSRNTLYYTTAQDQLTKNIYKTEVFMPKKIQRECAQIK